MTGADIDGIHGTPYIAAPLGSVMGYVCENSNPNLWTVVSQKKTVRFPSTGGAIPMSDYPMVVPFFVFS